MLQEPLHAGNRARRSVARRDPLYARRRKNETAQVVKWAALIFLLACAEPSERAKPEPVKWDTMTADKCIALCAPLPVARFTPQCTRKARESSYYYCAGKYAAMDDVCMCGKEVARKPEPAQAPQVDTVTPVLLHHGLKAVLKH